MGPGDLDEDRRDSVAHAKVNLRRCLRANPSKVDHPAPLGAGGPGDRVVELGSLEAITERVMLASEEDYPRLGVVLFTPRRSWGAVSLSRAESADPAQIDSSGPSLKTSGPEVRQPILRGAHLLMGDLGGSPGLRRRGGLQSASRCPGADEAGE
jgi:hypothetical protein